MIDLHIHTTASDGSHSPSEIVKMAYEDNLKTIAITDHDTVGGIEEALNAMKNYNIEVIPGIELKADYKETLHILGYFVNHKSKEFNDFLNRRIEERENRNHRFVEYFNSIGMNITYDEVIKEAGGVDSTIGKPHFTSLLLKKGYIKNVDEAYDEYFEKEPLKSIKIYSPSPKDVIEQIKKSGGIAVIAHPGLLKQDEKEERRLIEELISYGLSGIEVFHSDHDEKEREKYLGYAEEYNLIVTGGSDYHGEEVKPNLYLGKGIKNNTIIRDTSIVCELKDKLAEINNEEKMTKKRCSSRGVIIKDDKLLVLKRTLKERFNGEPYYVTPGGGRENSETLRNTLIREMREEIDSEIVVNDLLTVLETDESYEHYYDIMLKDYENLHLGCGDGEEFVDESRGLYELCWLEIERLENYRFFPEEIIPNIKSRISNN